MNNDSLFKEILMVKQLNLVNLFEYKDAYLTNQYILNNFSHVCTEEEIADLSNTGSIWRGLENSAKQVIKRPVDVKIQLSRDHAKLANVPVTVSGKTKNFVFDTGANFSVIQRSVALEMGCEIIPIQFDVSAITGAKVKSDLAVIKELEMGDLICENVVFLVFDDKDLTFSEVDYSIQGIIGFPVIRNLEEIHITKDDQLIIPKSPEVYTNSNMILNGFVPVVQVTQQSDTLQFSFDTGAVETSLNSAYYTKYKKKVEKKGKQQTLKSGGAGGMVEYEGYVLPKVTIAVGISEVTLRDVQVRKDDVGEVGSNFDGNLGQDFIKQFNEMIISFKYSNILFK
jgi:predicted aspartyl protease